MKTKTPPKQKSRQITLDPIRKFLIPLELHEVESTIPCGFRMGWIEGEADKKPFDLSAGAGCGSPYLTLSYDGRSFCVDMRKVVKQFIESVNGD